MSEQKTPEQIDHAFAVAAVVVAIREKGFKGLRRDIVDILRQQGVEPRNIESNRAITKIVIDALDVTKAMVLEDLVEAEADAKKKNEKTE